MLVDAFSTSLSNVSCGRSDSSLTKNSGQLNHRQYSSRMSNFVTCVGSSATLDTWYIFPWTEICIFLYLANFIHETYFIFIKHFHFWYIVIVLESDRKSRLLIFTVIELNIVTFILVVNTAICSSKLEIVTVLISTNVNLNLQQINEDFLASLFLDQK